jgi:hypothetical protein
MIAVLYGIRGEESKEPISQAFEGTGFVLGPILCFGEGGFDLA